MKVRVSYTVDVGDFFRRAVSHHYGIDRPATRAEIRDWFRAYGESGDDDVIGDYQGHLERLEEREGS